jgi:hypothetical protein
MKVVKTRKQIANNITELERGRNPRGKNFKEYRKLIKLGICFLPYKSQKGLSFAPSRFVGYVNNKLATHADNLDKNGRKTNDAINSVLLGTKPTTDVALGQAYIEFCRTIGVTPSKRGAFGRKRKYWITPEVLNLLEERAEDKIGADPNLSETEKQQLVEARIGQGVFRERLIAMWGKCCVTGCDCVDILRASHIKPWRSSTNDERLDKFNGLLLSPNLDALFDKGLISFKDSGEILISRQLPVPTRKALGCPNGAKVPLQKKHAKYMKWHRKNVFVDTEA